MPFSLSGSPLLRYGRSATSDQNESCVHYVVLSGVRSECVVVEMFSYLICSVQ